MYPPEASIHELWVKDVGLARTRDVACRVCGGRSSAARSGNNASAAQHLLALDGRSPRLNSRGSLAAGVGSMARPYSAVRPGA